MTKNFLIEKPAQLLLLASVCAWSLGCSASKDDSAARADANTTAASLACPTAKTARGAVMGRGANDACSYLGIPYAAPPTGDLRWKPPQPAAAWTKPRPSAAASACPQAASELGQASTDEDCLYLNVWVPSASRTDSASARPVMVFVHGGGFTTGAGTVPLYDGTKLANATGAIVVTINYRLGAFGFLSHPALRAEDPAHPSAGNYGIEDQIAAFRWVKDNAKAFGGDPSNVTIFGESAGGTSMLVHLASPKSEGLFDRVIVESAWAQPGSTSFTTTAANVAGARVAWALDCTNEANVLSCMRERSAADVLQAVESSGSPIEGGIAFAAVVDGFVLPDDPVKILEQGSFNKVPTMIGTNRNEGTLFFYIEDSGLDVAPPVDAASYQALEERIYPGHGAAIVAEYPIASFGGSYKAAAAEAMGDAAFVCGARRIARALAAAGVPTFRYDFAHALDLGLPELGAFHASELPFVFGNPLKPEAPLKPGDLPVVKQVMAYWGSMAKHGDPGAVGQLEWPRYTATNETQLVIDVTTSTESAFKKGKCDFWDRLAK